MHDLEMGDQKRTKYLKMHDLDLKMKDQMQGHENAGPGNAGPQKHDRELEHKLAKATARWRVAANSARYTRASQVRN